MSELTSRFPAVLFEGCSSGGNRFDLGMLCYFPQIWASDNTDAVCRCRIQNSYSYGYPQSTIASHVSDVPNHQTLRNVALNTRFNIAAFGVLGFELDLTKLNSAEIEEIKKQVSFYKEIRNFSQFGRVHRLEFGNIVQ